MNNTECPIYLSLEGNIGVGKSTFLNILKENLNITAIFEPVDKWENIEELNILEKFYEDPKRWAYTFQNYAFITRVRSISDALNSCNKQLAIQERSVFSDKYVFAKNCYEHGLMSKLEWHIYLDWFNWLVKLALKKPAGFIYLKNDPKISYNRIVQRSRSAEINISLNYLESLYNKHEEWFTEKKDISDFIKNTPVLILECNKDFKSDVEFQRELVDKVRDFIKTNFKILI